MSTLKMMNKYINQKDIESILYSMQDLPLEYYERILNQINSIPDCIRKCKDCKYWKEYTFEEAPFHFLKEVNKSLGECKKHSVSVITPVIMPSDGYCSSAKSPNSNNKQHQYDSAINNAFEELIKMLNKNRDLE